MNHALTLILILSTVAASPAWAVGGDSRPDDDQIPERVFGPALSSGEIVSNGTAAALAARETAGPDTFALYGGPDHPTEGKFQFADGARPDWGDGSGVPSSFGPGAWIPVDLTDTPNHWHVDTFNAGNLNGHGEGNLAMWCGVDSDDPMASTWVHTPGYGNNWQDALIYESDPVSNPSAGQVVDLDFFFNYDNEPWYDFFVVQYDSAGMWKTVYYATGSNKDASNVFTPPGVHYSTQASQPIQFSGNDYSGNDFDQIRIRFLVTSDGAWSDEDGRWSTHGGAAQIDDITLTNSLGVFTEDFEGSPPYLVNQDKQLFAGDFAEVHPRLSDIDPCRENTTPVVAFIDYGQNVRNGPAADGVTWSTGGETSPGVLYGIPGNYVVNHSGGLSFGGVGLKNEVWSPPIAWDLPGAGDDGREIAGAFIRLDFWGDMPDQGLLWGWSVRSALPGENFGTWQYGSYGIGFPVWYSGRWDISSKIQPGCDRIQLSLWARDYADVWGYPGNASTPAPAFDNVAVYKYRLGGPVLRASSYHLAQDAFPANGSADASSASSRDALDIRFDMTDFASPTALGDSVAFSAIPLVQGTSITDLRMIWALDTNPVFEDAIRSAPSRPEDESVVAGAAGTIWTGEVVADSCTNSLGVVFADRFFADLPDEDFMYPGDVLHYYIRATDSDGNVSTMPTDISGFGDFSHDTAYSRRFTVRGVPSIQDAAGAQPRLLVINDRDRVLGSADFRTSLGQLGYVEGIDYDSFTHQYPYGGTASFGTAGSGGASVGQLSTYHNIFYLSGIFSLGTLSYRDVGLLEQWHADEPGPGGGRNIAYFGDGLTTELVADAAVGLGYLYNTMGVDWRGPDVRTVIAGQTAPVVTPGPAYASFFASNYLAYGGCASPLAGDLKETQLGLNLQRTFAYIRPLAGAEVGHYFTSASGVPLNGPSVGVASVVHPTAFGLDVTFPTSMIAIYDVTSRAADTGARTALIGEVLDLFGSGAGSSPVVAAPAPHRLDLGVVPNPFNPSTTIAFTATPGTKGSVKIFNIRGELVRTLHSGEFVTQDFEWNGTDDGGASVAAGVYLVRAEAAGKVRLAKVALVK